MFFKNLPNLMLNLCKVPTQFM